MAVKKKITGKRVPIRGDRLTANFIARGTLIQAIQEDIREREWTQAEAAEFLGVTQPRISHLMQGRVDQFTVDMLMLWSEKLGKDVSVEVRSSVFASKEKVILTLYVLGKQKEQTVDMVGKLFAHDQSKYELTVIDVLEDPEAARKARITTPSLVKESPAPRTVFVGDLSAASIRWQVENAEQRSREERDAAQDLRQAKQDAREDEQNAREQRQEQRQERHSKRYD